MYIYSCIIVQMLYDMHGSIHLYIIINTVLKYIHAETATNLYTDSYIFLLVCTAWDLTLEDKFYTKNVLRVQALLHIYNYTINYHSV